MQISSWKQRLLGQVHFTVSGLTLERLLNIAVKNNITLYKVERVSYTCISAVVSAVQYKILQRLLPEGNYRLQRKSIKGGAGVAFALRRRYMLWAGALLCAALLVIASQRVWLVHVEGAEKLSAAVVEQKLQDYDLLSWKGDMEGNLEAAEKQLLKDMPELSWASLSVQGVVLHAYIKEKPEEVEPVPRDTPADIVAQKDGVVEQVTVLQGTAAVKKGQTISKGQTLISGQLVFSDVPYRYISAQGSVKAKVWYYDTITVGLTREITQRTGKSATVRTMDFLGLEINLEGSNPFSLSEYEETTAPESTLGLPMTVRTRTYYELEKKTEAVSQTEAITLAEEQILDALQEQIPDAAVFSDRKTTVEPQTDGTLRVTMYIETIEEIGLYKELEGGGTP